MQPFHLFIGLKTLDKTGTLIDILTKCTAKRRGTFIRRVAKGFFEILMADFWRYIENI